MHGCSFLILLFSKYYKLLIRKSIFFSISDCESGVLLSVRAHTHTGCFFLPLIQECDSVLMM